MSKPLQLARAVAEWRKGQKEQEELRNSLKDKLAREEAHEAGQLDLIDSWLRQAMDYLRENQPVRAFYCLQRIEDEVAGLRRKKS